MVTTRRPRASVCIPAFNCRETLPEALEHLERQTLRDFEVLVCDDGSTDGTWEYLQGLDRPNVRILRNPENLNLPVTMRRLFDEARGELICMHHDHEYVREDWLASMSGLFERYPRVGMAVAAYDLRHAGGELVRRPRTAQDDLFRAANPLPGSAVVRALAVKRHTPISAHASVFRADVVERAGGYSEQWWLASDEDLYFRVAAISDVVYCTEPVAVVATRPEGREYRLGSLPNLYSTFELRKAVTRSVWGPWSPARAWNLVRLSALEAAAMVRETLRRWLYGTRADLEAALRLDELPVLPSGRGFLPVPADAAWRAAVRVLVLGAGFGRGLGRVRRRIQGRAL